MHQGISRGKRGEGRSHRRVREGRSSSRHYGGAVFHHLTRGKLGHGSALGRAASGGLRRGLRGAVLVVRPSRLSLRLALYMYHDTNCTELFRFRTLNFHLRKGSISQPNNLSLPEKMRGATCTTKTRRNGVESRWVLVVPSFRVDSVGVFQRGHHP